MGKISLLITGGIIIVFVLFFILPIVSGIFYNFSTQGRFYEKINIVFSENNFGPMSTEVFGVGENETLLIQNINAGEYDKNNIYFSHKGKISKELNGLKGNYIASVNCFNWELDSDYILNDMSRLLTDEDDVIDHVSVCEGQLSCCFIFFESFNFL
jgi:hypothetical protein